METRVLIAEDHQIVRQGLKGLLEREGFQVVAEASTGHEAIRRAEELDPDVAVLDFSMPLLNGLDVARELAKVSPRTKSILLTVHAQNQLVLEALGSGVKGFVLKTQALADLVQAIHEVLRDAIYLSPSVSKAVVDACLGRTGTTGDPLSPRERQVLQLVAEGKSTKEVATLLGITFKTAESHRTRIMDKLDIHGVAGLVRYAVRQGLIQP